MTTANDTDATSKQVREPSRESTDLSEEELKKVSGGQSERP